MDWTLVQPTLVEDPALAAITPSCSTCVPALHSDLCFKSPSMLYYQHCLLLWASSSENEMREMIAPQSLFLYAITWLHWTMYFNALSHFYSQLSHLAHVWCQFLKSVFQHSKAILSSSACCCFCCCNTAKGAYLLLHSELCSSVCCSLLCCGCAVPEESDE